MDKRHRVLVLAYFFPPLGGGGVQRTLKFVRYLEPLGWDATVITTEASHYPARDPSLLDDVPASTRVIRAPALPIARWIGLVLHRLKLMRLYALVTWPDGGIGWAPFAFFAALRAVRRERPDVIFSTSAPYGAHLAAMLLARRTGTPWVADFRDEWASNSHLREQPGALLRLPVLAERATVSTARRIVVAADYFQLEGLAADDPRRTVIANGVDQADLPSESTGPPADRFVLTNVGTVYGSFDPSPVLRALATLVERGDIDRERYEVRFVGSIWSDDFRPPSVLRFECTGYVDHACAVKEMTSATALLLYRPSSSLAPSGKLFEYLASGRPLLCVTDRYNLASRLVRDWDAGMTAEPDDAAALEQAILALWQRWLEDGLPDQAEVRGQTLRQFSRQAGAARLAHVFEEVLRG